MAPIVDLIKLDKLISAGRQRVILPKQLHHQTYLKTHMQGWGGGGKAVWSGRDSALNLLASARAGCVRGRGERASARLSLDTLLLRLAQSADQAISSPALLRPWWHPSKALVTAAKGTSHLKKLRCL